MKAKRKSNEQLPTCSLNIFFLEEIIFLRAGPAAQTKVSEDKMPHTSLFYLKLCWREIYYRSFYMHKLILRRVAACIPPYMTDTLRCNQHTFQKQIMKHKESYKSETSLKGGGCGAHINTSFKNLLSAISLQWDSIFRPTNT